MLPPPLPTPTPSWAHSLHVKGDSCNHLTWVTFHFWLAGRTTELRSVKKGFSLQGETFLYDNVSGRCERAGNCIGGTGERIGVCGGRRGKGGGGGSMEV